MGSTLTLAQTYLRPFVTGMSGTPNDPVKTDGIAAFADADARLGALESGGLLLDCLQFGITGGSDQTTQFAELRNALLANDGSTVKFHSGVNYQYQSPKWAYGVQNMTIEAYGATFHNLSAGTRNGSDMDTALYLGSGPIFFTQTIGDVFTGSGSPATGVTATSGFLLQADAIAGDSTITLTPANAATLAAGNNIMINWFNRQAVGFPPNPGYFEYNVVASSNGGTGVVTLLRPLRNTYRGGPDYTSDSITCGAARCLNLNRSGDYQIAQSVKLYGGAGVVTGAGPAYYDGALGIYGALDVQVYDTEFVGVFPSMVKKIYLKNSKFTVVSELDKIIQEIDFIDCQTNTLDAAPLEATGVDTLRFIGGSVTGAGVLQPLSKHVLIDGVDIFTNQTTSGTKVQVGLNFFPCRRLEIRNCGFFPNTSQVAGAKTGLYISFTPDAVTATSIMVLATNANYAQISKSIDIGARITRAASGAGSQADVFVVTDLQFDGSFNLNIYGYCNVATPSIASIVRALWVTQRAKIDDSNKIFGPNGITNSGFPLTYTYQGAWNGSPIDEGGLLSYRFPVRAAGANEQSLNGTLISVEVDVVKPYTGSDTSATLVVGSDSPGPSWSGMTINLKVAGTRFVGIVTGQTYGNQSGDTLNFIGQGTYCQHLELFVSGQTSFVFTDAAPASLPIVNVTAKVSQV